MVRVDIDDNVVHKVHDVQKLLNYRKEDQVVCQSAFIWVTVKGQGRGEKSCIGTGEGEGRSKSGERQQHQTHWIRERCNLVVMGVFNREMLVSVYAYSLE